MTVRRTRQDSVRVAAAWVVERTLASLAPADSFLESSLARFDQRDRALLRELVFGTLRWLRRLDDVIARASDRRIDEIEPALLPVLRVAVYQLLFLSRIPAHAVVNEAVEEARCFTHRGAASFANAVLRRIAKDRNLEDWPVAEDDPVRRLAIEWSHPDLLVARWLEAFGEAATVELMRVNNLPKPMHLLAFRHRGGRELLAEELIDHGIEVDPSPLSPLGLTVRRGNPLKTPAFRRGLFYIQDEISQAAVLLPPPKAGERILDLAASPGGKSFALFAWEPRVRLVTAEVSLVRSALLRANLRRLDLPLPLLLGDGGQPPLVPATFDRVIADLPCSGTGTLRKHPELKWRLSEGEIGRLCGDALRILDGAASLVRPGGLLISMTCSLERDENEGLIAQFRDRHPEFRPEELGEGIPPALKVFIQAPGVWRVPPADDHDGFTVQVLRRAAGG
jgi:16S rRNA (cytosine967-C5)-methyltransferase